MSVMVISNVDYKDSMLRETITYVMSRCKMLRETITYVMCRCKMLRDLEM